MESSRRSAMDRSREPGSKRPRLAAEDAVVRDRAAFDRDRLMPPARAGNQPLVSRLPRARGREGRDDAARVGSHQELVAQYRMALAELTFNSKPIITNLTIIAGESLHAAKEIAAVICANVLEVTSEQKLPSLYLLDSIVKNLGRDYIRYFAARLPEVFCKAYKQVDSSTRASMRHLFGTWRGVFPPASLQLIEKELGFPPVINVSSGSVSSKLDSQPQRPAHSIHVNPKYLEARQKLQSSRAKDISNDEVSGVVSTFDDAESSDKIVMAGKSRQWTNLSTKMPNMQHSQRVTVNNVINEKKGRKDARDHEYSSDFSREADLGILRVSERLKDQDGHGKPYYGVGITATQAQFSERNGFDVNHSYGTYGKSGPMRANSQQTSVCDTDRTKLESSRSWKNSEEEEYMWDDIKTRPTDYGGTNNLIKGGWTSGNADKSACLQRGKWIPPETEHAKTNLTTVDAFSHSVETSKTESRVPLFKDLGEQILPSRAKLDTDSVLQTSSNPLLQQRASSENASSFWSRHDVPASEVGINYKSSRVGQQLIPSGGGLSTHDNSSLPLPGLQSSVLSSRLSPHANIPVPSATFEQQRQHLSQPPRSLSSHLPPPPEPIQHLKPRNLTDQDQLLFNSFSHMGRKPLQLVGSLDIFPVKNHAQPFDSLSGSIESQSETSQQIEGSLDSATSASLNHLRDHLPLIKQSRHNLSQQQAETQPLSRTEAQTQPSLKIKTQSRPSHQTEKLPPLPMDLGIHQTGKDSGTSHANNPVVEASSQPSTSSLLAAIMNSGLFSNNSVNNIQKMSVQPPLPVGPPPVQVSTSAAPLSTPLTFTPPFSLGNTPDLKPPHSGDVIPPLPLGPPPSSSLVDVNSENSKTSGPTPSPFSGLLSSLVAKGLIASQPTVLITTSVAQLPDKVQDQCSSTSLEQVSLISTTPGVPPPLEDQPDASVSTAAAALVQCDATALEDHIGTEFKSEIVRGSHPAVVRSLFDDLKLQCHKCGLRFRLQEQLQCHLDWHVSEESETSNFNQRSRKWFSEMRYQQSSSEVAISLEEVGSSEKNSELMVPADESQSICALCGEPFEDIYSEARDEWMYKGTVYLDLSKKQNDASNTNGTSGQLPIVHAHCMSQRFCHNMDVAEHDKEDQTNVPIGLF
ncbi:hypothetical protein OPV22_000066 [Ensete ventricosum]|uniref:CID domain-containing protein n=1 Tax=Ensete ventricosum TaxID=4639 RepID=A0AAV8RUZ0_ENSVE|nr:hypothetical protein OPV22_000066 [Ensete ventricosum]